MRCADTFIRLISVEEWNALAVNEHATTEPSGSSSAHRMTRMLYKGLHIADKLEYLIPTGKKKGQVTHVQYKQFRDTCGVDEYLKSENVQKRKENI